MTMSSLVGRELAHYRILETIGSGGMGDVYLAEDTKLDRRIALKVLPAELAENEERRARFEREAKALAALNHPRIVTVYSVEKHDGIHFITMELVQGKKLSELLPFGLAKFFDVAIALADGVAAAHEHGITHRDLKPDNVMVTNDGDVKVLDFGLAKPRAGFTEDSDPESPTALKTQEGGIVGTVHYMSPEQAEGKAVDHRTDIFSLGIIYYEMLTGKRPFQGDTPAAVLSSIIKDEPAALEKEPPVVERIVKRCLAKTLNHRLQSTLDLKHELEDVRDASSLAETQTTPRSAWPRLGTVVVAALLGGALVSLLRSDVSPRVPRLVNPVQITTAVGLEDYPTWSPDGSAVAYAATLDGDHYGGNWDIWVKPVSGGQAVNRTSGHPGADKVPSWSPDGTQIAFWSDRDGGGYFVMSALGGSPRRVTAFVGPEPSSPRWSPDSTELASVVRDSVSGSFLEIVNLGTRESRRIDLPGNDLRRLDLAWSPDGKLVAYVDAFSTNADATRVVLLRIEDGKDFGITDRSTKDWSPTWAPDSRTLYFTSGQGGNADLWQQTLTESGNPDGEPSPVTGGLILRRVSLAPDGTKIAYSKGRMIGNLWRVPILTDRPATWNDAEQLTFDEAEIEGIDVSPDGTHVLFDSDRNGNADLWVLELETRELTQITTHPADDFSGRWAPDGKTVAFYSLRGGNRNIWLQDLDGGPAMQLTHGDSQDVFPSWSADGASVVYTSMGPNLSEARATSRSGELKATRTLPGVTQPMSFDLSRHGKGLVVVDYAEEHTLWHLDEFDGDPRRIGSGLAHLARWSLDGNAIYLIPDDERSGNLWAMSIDGSSQRAVTRFAGRIGAFAWFALATDGDYLYFVWQENLGDIWTMEVVY